MKRIVLAIVGIQYAAALLIEAVSGFHYTPDFWSFFVAAICMTIFTVGGIAAGRRLLIDSAGVAGLPRDILAAFGRSDVPVIYLAVAAQLCVLAWLKALMPYSIGFRFDGLLADMDAAIFGTDPWRLIQWLPAQLIDPSYITWVVPTITLAALLPHLPKTPIRDRAIVTFFLTYASASLGQYLLPSAGPIFFERIGLGDRFSQLPAHHWVQVTSDYLWVNYLSHGQNIGVGISAFPSLHVGGTAWVAIVASSYSKMLAPIVWGYFILILLGSVYLGWHYALDGVAGLLMAFAMWRLVAWLQRGVPRLELAVQGSD